MPEELELGIVGLGTIGGNLARQALEKDIRVVGKDIEDRPALREAGVQLVDDHQELVEQLSHPRVIYLSLPAGEVIDHELEKLRDVLEEGDVVADGGNSFWQDSMNREEAMWEEGIYFLDAGTSGGLPGARAGAAFMVGGRDEGVRIAEPIFERLSVEGGYVHTGEPGSGHFVKLVHNGIEFGMLQAIGEGVELLEAGEFDLDLAAIFEEWRHGTVIRSWLVDLMAKGLEKEDQFEGIRDFRGIDNYVEDTGEVNWLAMWAIEQEKSVPVIMAATEQLFASRGEPEHTYRAIALMRHGFGGHPFGVDDDIARKRGSSRIEEL